MEGGDSKRKNFYPLSQIAENIMSLGLSKANVGKRIWFVVISPLCAKKCNFGRKAKYVCWILFPRWRYEDDWNRYRQTYATNVKIWWRQGEKEVWNNKKTVRILWTIFWYRVIKFFYIIVFLNDFRKLNFLKNLKIVDIYPSI